jgi:hypothetical protein
MRWGDGAARRAVHAVIRRERAKCAGLPSEEREKGPNRAVGEKANQRLCDAQAAGARPAPDVATFTEVTRPSTVEASTYRLRFGEPQVMAVTSAIVGVRPPARRLRQPTLGRLVGASLDRPYPSRQATYNLRRLKRKGLIVRPPGQHRYQLTPQGRLAILFTNTYGRLSGPALPRLTHAYLRNWFDEARWPSPGANSTAH